LGGGLALLLVGAILVYLSHVVGPAERSLTKTAEASLTGPTLPRDSKSVDSMAVRRTEAKMGVAPSTKAPNTAGSPPQILSGAARDEAYRRLLVGKWETERSGHREMTVRADGTATMVVRLDGVNAMLFGKKLTFWLKWSIQDGKLAFETTGGEPASRIKVITVMYGTNRVQRIRSLTKIRLLLIDEEGDPDHDYRRVAARTE